MHRVVEIMQEDVNHDAAPLTRCPFEIFFSGELLYPLSSDSSSLNRWCASIYFSAGSGIKYL